MSAMRLDVTDQHKYGRLSVAGYGSASALADMACLTTAVEARKTSAQNALAESTATANALLKVLEGQGVCDRDVRTERAWINPEYDHTGKRSSYTSGKTFSVDIRNIAATRSVIEELTSVTGNSGRILGIVFGVSDDSLLRQEAHSVAYQDACLKAKQFASRCGLELSSPVSIHENEEILRPSRLDYVVIGERKLSPEVAPGRIDCRVKLTVVYILCPPVGEPLSSSSKVNNCWGCGPEGRFG